MSCELLLEMSAWEVTSPRREETFLQGVGVNLVILSWSVCVCVGGGVLAY